MKNIDQNIIEGWAKKIADSKGEAHENIEMKEEFDAYKNTWDKLKEMQEIEQFDTDNAWNNLFSKINADEVDVNAGKVKKVNFTRVLAVAASVAILIGLAAFMSYSVFFGQVSYSNSGLTSQLVELPDGTKVYLNSNSQIEYKKTLISDDKREVKLSGEAFFDVARDVNHPFIISADDSFIKVLGTSFNVNAKTNNVEVVVKTGKVEVYNTNKTIEHVVLLPGDRAVVINNNEIAKSVNKKENYLAWLDRKLIFKAMPLAEVILDLENTYHCNIEMEDTSIANLKITSTFDNDSLDDILQSIALTFNLDIAKEGKKYTLVSN